MAKFSSPLDAVIGLTEAVTKDWTKQRKAEERDSNARTRRLSRLTQVNRVTIRDAVFQVMAEAYPHASTKGTLPANPRQIYYAARRQILLATHRDVCRAIIFCRRCCVIT
jgi:hypothetical protein